MLEFGPTASGMDTEGWTMGKTTTTLVVLEGVLFRIAAYVRMLMDRSTKVGGKVASGLVKGHSATRKVMSLLELG